MAYDFWAWLQPEEYGEGYAEVWGDITLDGTGTTTAFTFSGVNMPNMRDTNYQVLLTAQSTVATPVTVSASSKAVTGFTLEHPNNSSVTVSYLARGKVDRD